MSGRISAIASVAVAMLVMLAVPVSQLRLIAIDRVCCCPDPDRCHCPSHDGDTAPQSSIRACHNTEQVYVTPHVAAFVPASIVVAAVAQPTSQLVMFRLREPHPPPPPRRPDAPS